MNTESKVKEFNQAFGLMINESPTLVSEDQSKLGCRLMQEELDEYKDALEEGDLVEVADAIVDMQYILDGLKVKHGISGACFRELFDEVHKSNMSKLEDGKPVYREDGKVMKGKDYFKPDISSIIVKHREYKMSGVTGKESLSAVRKAALPLIEYLAEHEHPHSTVMVTCTSFELLHSYCGEGKIYDYIK